MKNIILLTVELYPDAIGGRGQYARYLYELLNVKTITPKRRINLRLKNGAQVRLPFSTMRHALFLIAYPIYVIKAVAFILKEKPTIVISNTVYDALPPMLTGAKFIFILHDVFLFKKGIISKALAKIALKKSIAIVSPSKATISMLNYKISQRITPKVSIIANPVDVDAFKKVDLISARSWLRSKTGSIINESTKVILYVGPISTLKGVHLLLDAYSRLEKERNDLLLVLAGRFVDGVSNESLRSSRIKYLGIITPPRIYYLFKAANIVVNPSMLEETQGRTVIEALAAEKYLIASATPAFIETAKDAGYYFKQGDVEDLYAKLRAILERVDAGFLENSKAMNVAKNYSLSKFKESWLALTGKCLATLNEFKPIL